MDFGGFGRFEEVASRVGASSRLRLGAWLACIVAVTAVAVVRGAPAAVYEILLVVASAIVARCHPGDHG